MNESLLEMLFLPDDLHLNAYQNLRHNPFLIQVNSYDIEQSNGLYIKYINILRDRTTGICGMKWS